MGVVKKINFTIFLMSVILLVVLLIKPIPLPAKSDMTNTVVDTQPIMQKVDEPEYVKNFAGVNYRIKPYYSYEINGLVVADYDADDWLDITHKKDPAQTKDLCLVWGDNIETGAYRESKFKHGEFTCYYQYGRDVENRIVNNQISNNHLVPENEELRNAIKEATIGDQVYIKGKLVDYTILDENGKDFSYRKTSTELDFRHCEVILVSDFKILKSTPYYLKNAKSILAKVSGASFILGLILLFF